VKNAVQRKDRLAGILALPARPTFKDYLIFQRDERSFRSCIITIKRNGAYRDWLNRWTAQDDKEDDEVFDSSGLWLMLKAGFTPGGGLDFEIQEGELEELGGGRCGRRSSGSWLRCGGGICSPGCEGWGGGSRLVGLLSSSSSSSS
jgi:hypothetical protein